MAKIQNDAQESRLQKFIGQAHSLAEQGDLEESLKVCSEILNIDPDRGEALFIAGYAFLKADKYGLAYCLMEKCVQLFPDREQAWNNLGLIAANLHKHEEAMSYLKRSLQIKPNQTESRNNVALVHVNECRPLKAIEWADTSLAINPNQNDVQETRGYASLMVRHWADGWKGYEAAVNNSKYRKPKPMGDEPYWDGSKVNKLFVRTEQGIGDEVMFASCLADAQRDVNSITLECDGRLEGLFKRSFPAIKVYGTRQQKHRPWTDEYDANCLIGSLPSHYRTTYESFPGTPFLKTDPDRVLQWKALLDKLPGKKVGLAWTGGLTNTFSARRSLSLSQLSPLFDVPGITWVSLQYKESDLTAPVKIHHWKRGAEAQDIEDVAALIDSLDLVISVSTATVHIAGGLGKECWVLVPEKPHWIYGLEGDDLPWYGSVKLFRQQGSWDGIINELGERLASHIRGDGPSATDSVHSTSEQHHPASIQAGIDHTFNLKPTANFSGRSDRVHVQPLSSPFSL